MSPRWTRRLHVMHRWAGIVLTANVLVLTLTGLVLVFRHEIDDLLGVPAPPAEAAGTAPASMTSVFAHARAAFPGEEVRVVSRDEENPRRLFVSLYPPGGARTLEGGHSVAADAATGRVLPGGALDDTFTGWMLRLHAQLFLGTRGALLLGVVGAAFLALLITGAFLYGPFAKGRSFGARRAGWRVGLSDLHKLIGACTWAWNVVVGATGVLLSVVSLLLRLWSGPELAAMTSAYDGRAVPSSIVSPDVALAAAEKVATDRHLALLVVPGTQLSGYYHYALFMRGTGGLEARLFEIVLVDAATGTVTERRQLPWYLRAVLVSEPLHFGDYAGLPLKIIWATFALGTLGLTASGVVSFCARRRRRRTLPMAEVAS